jgi:hypothetical protein
LGFAFCASPAATLHSIECMYVDFVQIEWKIHTAI